MKETDIYGRSAPEKVGKFGGDTTYNTLLSASKRTPLEGNRVFKTKAHMIAYIEDRLLSDGTISEQVTSETVKSALPGLILTVVSDPTTENNGAYYINNGDSSVTPGLVAEKFGASEDPQRISDEQIDSLFEE
jgi:hypothetical protein